MLAFRRTATLTIAASCLVAAHARAQTAPAAGARRGAPARAAGQTAPRGTCQVRGVWELVSTSVDGADEVRPGYRQRKVLTSRHFMWLGEDAKRDTLPLKTAMDSLRATRIMGGSGTYTVQGNSYTERLDYFYQPNMIGQTLRATCRTVGDRWYHVFTVPFDTVAARGRFTRLSELWRRVE